MIALDEQEQQGFKPDSTISQNDVSNPQTKDRLSLLRIFSLRMETRFAGSFVIHCNSSAQDFAPAAKSVRMRKGLTVTIH